MTGSTIKALPLWQPWATLVAAGAKRIETRSYPPARVGLRDGQRIAIHATKRETELWLCSYEYFVDHLPPTSEIPLGAILATCTLERGFYVTAGWGDELRRSDPQEHMFGNYAAGRWAWFLRDVERLPEPVPFRGSQGTFDVPLELLGLPVDEPAQGRLL